MVFALPLASTATISRAGSEVGAGDAALVRVFSRRRTAEVEDRALTTANVPPVMLASTPRREHFTDGTDHVPQHDAADKLGALVADAETVHPAVHRTTASGRN